MSGPEWTDAEKILFPALQRAAETFADLAGALRVLGHPIAAEACGIAERDARFAYEDADKAERASSLVNLPSSKRDH